MNLRECRTVIAQTNPRLGDLKANLADHEERIRAAAAEGAGLILFPELSLTGYFLKDQVFELGLSIVDEQAPEICRLLECSQEITIGFGFVERTADGRLFNAYGFLEKGAVIGVHRKVHLVSYGMFDEARDFAAGESFAIVESRHGRIGPLICEDLWHAPGAYIHFLNGADLIVVASASPARGVEGPEPGLSSQRTWEQLLAAAALQTRTWLLYAGRVGWEDGVGFAGGSSVIDPFGSTVECLEGLEAGQLTATLDGASLERARVQTPLRKDAKPAILAAELARHVPLLEALANGGDEGAR